MRNLVLTSLAVGALGLAALPATTLGANALPAAGIAATPLPLASSQPEVTLVSGGCGPFRHRGFNGFCYPGGGFARGPYGFHRGYGYRRFRDDRFGYRRF